MDDLRFALKGQTASESARGFFLRLILQGIGWFFCSVSFVAIILNFTIQDTVRYVDIFYYMTPPTVILCLMVGATGLFAFSRKRTAALICGSLTLLISIWWFSSEWKFAGDFSGQQSRDQTGEVKVMFWNVARSQDQVKTLRILKEKRADIIGLVELEGNRESRREQLSAMFPDYDISSLGNYMYLLVKGTAENAVPIGLDEKTSSQARCVDVEVRGIQLSVILVDISADLNTSRENAISRLHQIMESYSDRPLITMGDFNLPIDSQYLAPFHKNHSEAFQTAGWGMTPTWPSFFPVLQLDQLWVNKKLKVKNSQRSFHIWESDHAAIEAVITVPAVDVTSQQSVDD